MIMKCSRKWFSQTVQEDVSLGFYDHIKGKVIIPNEQVYLIGEFNINGWKELDDEPEELKHDLEPNSFRINMVMLKLIPKIEGYMVPPIDTLINEKSIETL